MDSASFTLRSLLPAPLRRAKPPHAKSRTAHSHVPSTHLDCVDLPPFLLTHPSVSVCGSSPLLRELGETACPQPTEPETQIFSYAETVFTSSSSYDGASHNYSNSTEDDALIIDTLGDVLFGDETSESFADFTAPFAAQVRTGSKDEEEEAGGLSVHVVSYHSHDLDHVTVSENADPKYQYQGAAAAVPDDAALVDHFVANFLDPCFADQPKACAPSTPAAEESRPLTTTRSVAASSFGSGGGGGLTVPVVPSVPRPPSSTLSSFLPIPAPAVSAVASEASRFGFGPARAPAFALGLRPSDFKSKKEYRRVVAIPRYLAKRKRRQWNKEPTYSTRTDAAHRRARSNGKFSRSEAFVSASELKK